MKKAIVRFAQAILFWGMAAGCADYASAQQIASSRYYKVVDRGQRVKITFYATVDPTCRSLGDASVNLLREPQYGTVETLHGSSFPSFAGTNVRSACNRRKVPGTLLFYRAGTTGAGIDSFDVEAVFADGFARKFRYLVTVR